LRIAKIVMYSVQNLKGKNEEIPNEIGIGDIVLKSLIYVSLPNSMVF